MPSSFRPASSRGLLVLAILLLFQICVFSCRATAARILPHDGAAARPAVMKTSDDAATGHSSDRGSISSSSNNKGTHRVSNTEHFRRYFSVPPPPPSSSGSADVSAAAVVAGGSFEETKRKVPSCPDPLHN